MEYARNEGYKCECHRGIRHSHIVKEHTQKSNQEFYSIYQYKEFTVWVMTLIKKTLKIRNPWYKKYK